MAFIHVKRAVLFLGVSMSLNVSAAPTSADVEVIPGPGLPSLESLGLTSADLFRMSTGSTYRVDIDEQVHGVTNYIIIKSRQCSRGAYFLDQACSHHLPR